MKLGLWGARMDNSGLGQQTLEFYLAMKPAKTLVVDISVLESNPERKMRQYPGRYPERATFIEGIPNEFDIRQFLDGLDVVFIAESAYNMQLYKIAREMGVKTAVQYNYEFFDWFPPSVWANDTPDMFIAPSTWYFQEVDDFCKKRGIAHVYLHCPVNRDKITRRNIDNALSFVHIAGRPAANDRNGTMTFLEATTHDKENELRYIVYTQDKELEHTIHRDYPRVDVRCNVSNYADIYKKGSVLVLPRKYGGNCLPMNEALAAGMPVIMSKLSPQADFLPERWLISANETDIDFAPRFKIPVFECDPIDVFFRMRWFKSLSNQDMREQSNMADELAQSISWEAMKPKYEEALAALCLL